MIQNGANPNIINQYGHSALGRAVVGDNVKVVDVLLKGGADVNHIDKQNRTVLHISAKKGIKCNAKWCVIIRPIQHSQSISSIFPGNRKITKLIMDHGANANSADQRGRTPLHLVANSGKFDDMSVYKIKTKPSKRNQWNTSMCFKVKRCWPNY